MGLAGLAITISSCTTATNEVEVISQKRGTFTGIVHLGEPPFTTSQAGTLVQLAGTSLQGTTDSNGFFTIGAIPPGSYTISFSHEGYGPVQLKEFSIITPGVTTMFTDPTSSLSLYPLTSFSIHSFAVDSSYPDWHDSLVSVYLCRFETDSVIPGSLESRLFPAVVLTDVDPHIATPSISAFAIQTFLLDHSPSSFEFGPVLTLEDKKKIHHGSVLYLTGYLTHYRSPIDVPVYSNSIKVIIR